MIIKAPAKINLGLHIKGKRPDGFHELESIFIQIPLFDFVELIPAEEDKFESYNIPIPGDPSDNICTAAVQLLRKKGLIKGYYHIHLLKNIPIGAGLGGGSSDAVAVLKALMKLESIDISIDDLMGLAAVLGSDCPFFCASGPQRVTGRGEIMGPVEFNVNGKFLHLVYPGIHISTGEAYGSLDLLKTSQSSVHLPTHKAEWKTNFVNDFENALSPEYPVINDVKKKLNESGAFYSSLSGSGSSIFGFFDQQPQKLFLNEGYSEWILSL